MLRMFEETHSKTPFYQALANKAKTLEDLTGILQAELDRPPVEPSSSLQLQSAAASAEPAAF